jgi:regulator of protease activity HflC (stomatin/prohibitin superfamily)
VPFDWQLDPSLIKGAMSMTAHRPLRQWLEQAPPSRSVATDRLVRPLASLGLATMLAAGTIFVLSGRLKTSWFAALLPPDLAGIAVSSLLLAALGPVGCLCTTLARQRNGAPHQDLASKTGMRRTCGWQQTTVILLFTAGSACAVLVDWPVQTVANTLVPSDGFTAASALLLLATPWLLADRYLSTVTAERLPEIQDLRTLLFLPVFFLLAEAIIEIAGAVGFGVFHWTHIGFATVLLLICAELSVRVLGIWFLPPRVSGARAPIVSFVAAILRGRVFSSAKMAGVVRSQFGMDFSRSLALRFIRAAVLPVVLLMSVFCWFLTGVTRIDMNERGLYERFGTVASVLNPGLHLVLPLPFGVVRHAEFGVMHYALIGNADGADPDAADASSSEGYAPATANRLWDSEQPTDVSYIIASGEQNRQSFQTVSVSVRVLYRVGMTDGNARAALYRVADPDALVHSMSGRLLAQFFAARTLPIVLGENQRVIAGDMRAQLQEALDGLGSGIDVVAVIIEAIHPPSGAAAAYRNVQAAEIAATTSIAAEQGRAQTTRSVAQLNAHNATDDASASAAETVSSAQVDLINTAADERPYRAAPQPFVLERYFNDIRAALENNPLEIIDHRLIGSDAPTIDLRPPGTVRDGFEGRPNQARKTP